MKITPIFLLLCLAQSIFAQYKGKVTDGTGKPLPNAYVRLYAPPVAAEVEPDLIETAVTNGEGWFKLESREESATIGVRHPGHFGKKVDLNDPSLDGKVIFVRLDSAKSYATESGIDADQKGERVYSAVETPPSCTMPLDEYFRDSIFHPFDYNRPAPAKTLLVSFIIELDSSASYIACQGKNAGRQYRGEAERLILKSPKWVPGIVDGEPVRTAHTVAVNFPAYGSQPPKTGWVSSAPKKGLEDFLQNLGKRSSTLRKQEKNEYPDVCSCSSSSIKAASSPILK